MTLDDILERLEQFCPDELTAEEREDFCEWWRCLSDNLQRQARKAQPMDAMVADVAAYDRCTAYRLTINANQQYQHAQRQAQRLKERVAGLEAVNRFLNRELDRMFEK